MKNLLVNLIGTVKRYWYVAAGVVVAYVLVKGC